MRSASSREKRSGRQRSSSPTVTSVGHGDRADAIGGVVLDQRLGRPAERVDRLGVRARRGRRQPLVHDPLVPDPRREAPEVDDDEEVADLVGLPRRPDPAADDLVEEAIAAAPGAVEDEAAHLARDAPARAPARSPRPSRSRRRARARCRARPSARPCRPRSSAMRYWPGGVADRPTPRLSNVVIRQRSLRPATWSTQHAPSSARPGDEDDVVALSRLLGVQLHAVRVDHSHRAILERRTTGVAAPAACSCAAAARGGP